MEHAKNQVTLYVWNEVTIPNSNGQLVGSSSLKHYNPDRGIWTSFNAGHMVNVASNCATILLK